METAGRVPLLADERRAAIMSLLERDAAVQVTQLAQLFGTSKVTVRADLDALERAGKLRRTHGGAVSLSRRVTVSVQDERVNVNAQAKQAIGVAAAQLVGEGASLFVDSGTTSLELVRHLAGKSDLTIITTDLTIADFVDRSLPLAEVVLLGGSLRKGHRYTIGPMALHAMESMRPDLAFVCPTAYAPGRGLMTNHQDMAELKRMAMACGARSCVLLDSGKVGGSSLVRFGELADADVVVVDADSDGVIATELDGTSTRLVIA